MQIPGVGDPEEIPPPTPGTPAEPPVESPPGNPRPEVPTPINDPVEPDRPRELPPDTPDEMRGRAVRMIELTIRHPQFAGLQSRSESVCTATSTSEMSFFVVFD